MKLKKRMIAAVGAMMLAGGFCMVFAGNNTSVTRYLSPKLARASAQATCYCAFFGGNNECINENWGKNCNIGGTCTEAECE